MVVNHVVEALFPLNADFISQASASTKWLAFLGFTFGRTGVPLFFLLTGYLLLPRSYDAKRIKRFYRHNFLPMLLVWEVWILLYSVFLALYYNTPFSAGQYLRRALFLEHAGLPHTWYMPVILSIYLFLPFVATALHNMPGKVLAGLLAVSYTYLYIFPAINMVLQLRSPGYGLSPQGDLSYSGGVYGVYLVLGYAIARCQAQVKHRLAHPSARAALIAGALLLFVGTVYMQIFMYAHGSPYNVWYSYFTLPLLGCCVFLMLYTVKLPHWLCRPAMVLAENSFGIYLVHDPLLLLCLRWMPQQGSARALAVLSISIYAVSFALVWCLSLIPQAGRLFLRK